MRSGGSCFMRGTASSAAEAMRRELLSCAAVAASAAARSDGSYRVKGGAAAGVPEVLRREFQHEGAAAGATATSAGVAAGGAAKSAAFARCRGSASTSGAAEETAVERAARRELRCRGRQAAFHSALSVRRFRLATGVPKREALVGPRDGECGWREVLPGQVLLT